MALLKKKTGLKFDVKEQLWIVTLVLALGFLTIQIVNMIQNIEEQQVLEDSFISNVYGQYQQEASSCSYGGFTQDGQQQSASAEAQAQCLENLKNSRNAQLLEKWGYSDLLDQTSTSTSSSLPTTTEPAPEAEPEAAQ